MYARQSGSPGRKYGMYIYYSVRSGNTVKTVYGGKYHPRFSVGANIGQASFGSHATAATTVAGVSLSNSPTNLISRPSVTMAYSGMDDYQRGLEAELPESQRLGDNALKDRTIWSGGAMTKKPGVGAGLANVLMGKNWYGRRQYDPLIDGVRRGQTPPTLAESARLKEFERLIELGNKRGLSAEETRRASQLYEGTKTWQQVQKERGGTTFGYLTRDDDNKAKFESRWAKATSSFEDYQKTHEKQGDESAEDRPGKQGNTQEEQKTNQQQSQQQQHQQEEEEQQDEEDEASGGASFGSGGGPRPKSRQKPDEETGNSGGKKRSQRRKKKKSKEERSQEEQWEHWREHEGERNSQQQNNKQKQKNNSQKRRAEKQEVLGSKLRLILKEKQSLIRKMAKTYKFNVKKLATDSDFEIKLTERITKIETKKVQNASDKQRLKDLRSDLSYFNRVRGLENKTRKRLREE